MISFISVKECSQVTTLDSSDSRKTSVSSTIKFTEETIEKDDEITEEEIADIKMDPTPAEKLLQSFYEKPPSCNT